MVKSPFCLGLTGPTPSRLTIFGSYHLNVNPRLVSLHRLSFWFPMPFGFPKSFRFPRGPWLQVTCFSALLLGQLCVLLSEAQRPTLGFGLALGALLLSHKARQAPGFGASGGKGRMLRH